MLRYKIAVHFPKGYIGNPYWPETEKLINIIKQSGLSRARSADARRKALEQYLGSVGMSLSDYEALEAQSKEAWYRNPAGEIIIPELHTTSFLVATCDEIRSAGKPCKSEQVRARFTLSDWTTGKLESDGVWSRFAVVRIGTGQKASNQRGLRESQYIADFIASGEIAFDEGFVNVSTLRNAVEWGGANIGIGASRKMGWGRFSLVEFEQT